MADSMVESVNPCMQCGACCGYFRVSFYWAEGNDAAGPVPIELTEPLTPFLRCMQGTNSKTPRCSALDGAIGESVSCRIYANRPSPCHEFAASGENQRPNDACDRARAHYGMPPLTLSDVISQAEESLE